MRPYVALLALPAAALHAQSLPSAAAPAAPATAAAPTQAELDKAWERMATSAIVANVDGRAITTADIWNELIPTLMTLRQQARTREEYDRMRAEQRDKIRESLTDKFLILSESKEKGMVLPPSVVQEQIDEKITRDFNGDRNEYLRALRAQGRTPLDDRKNMEEEVLVSVAMNQIRKTVAELSPEKIQRYYEANRDAFSQPAGIKLSQIVLRPGAADTDEEVRKQAADIVARLDKGESFAELAKKYSKDDSRDQGGETPWHDVSQLNAELAKIVTVLKDGDHTKPMEFLVGGRPNIYIYRRDASRAEGPRPVAEVREVIENKLLSDTTTAVRAEWMARLRRHYFVRYYND